MMNSIKDRCGQGLQAIMIVILILIVFESANAQRNMEYIHKNTNVVAMTEMAALLSEQLRV